MIETDVWDRAKMTNVEDLFLMDERADQVPLAPLRRSISRKSDENILVYLLESISAENWGRLR